MTTTEQHANRRLTMEYIRRNPISLRLQSWSRNRDDQGSWRWLAGEKRYTQEFRLIESGSPGSNAQRSSLSPDGVEREIEFELLGEYCSDIRLYDRFEYDGDVYEIIEIFPDNGYEKRAAVTRRAET